MRLNTPLHFRTCLNMHATHIIILISAAAIVSCHPQHAQNIYSKSLKDQSRFGVLDSIFDGVSYIANIFSGLQDTVSIILNETQEPADLNAVTPEDARLNIMQLAAKYGYPIEEHSVTTEDGYIINFHRIPHGRNHEKNNLTVFLMHGFVDSSDSWVLQGPDKALAYILADQGFDVWMGNARGNKHGLRHATLNTSQPDFWEFTWEEIGIYDLQAMIVYTLHVTETDDLFYVGYSQGATSFYVMNSLKPEYNKKIKLMFALAPVAWTAKVRSPLVKMFAPAADLLGSVFWGYNLSHTEFLGSMSETICDMLGISYNNLLNMIIGQDCQNLKDVMPVVLGHMPTTASMLQLVHYGQLVKSRRFCRFDHGAERNMAIYGAESPPDYELGNVSVPVVTFFSENDWLAGPADVTELEEHLPNVIDSNLIVNFNHLDFLYAAKAKDTIYLKMIEHMLKF